MAHAVVLIANGYIAMVTLNMNRYLDWPRGIGPTINLGFEMPGV
jgi:hypothetical protein